MLLCVVIAVVAVVSAAAAVAVAAVTLVVVVAVVTVVAWQRLCAAKNAQLAQRPAPTRAAPDAM